YAVLAGAPALVAAVDRQAEVRIARRGGPGPLVVASLAEDERRVVDDDGRGELPGGDAGAVLAARRAVGPRVAAGDALDITGDPASTVPLLRRFSAAARERPALLRDLSLTAERAVAAVAAGDRVTFLDAVDRSGSLLEQLGREIELPIVTPALARLVSVARRA